MTAEVINLRRARKARARREAEVAAADNRVVFGTPKRERLRAAATEERRTDRLEAHRREQPASPASDEDR